MTSECSESQKKSKSEFHQNLPNALKIITLSRAVRWTGWGFGEPLLPIFILSFTSSYTEVGFIRSLYELVLLLSLPAIGFIADKVAPRKVILISLILYPLIGISYCVAGIFGYYVFVILARVINGFVWGLENTAINTYVLQITSKRKVASAFGFLETYSNLGWGFAAIFSIYLVKIMPIHYLLFLVAPFSLLAFLLMKKVPKTTPQKRFGNGFTINDFIETYVHFAKAIRNWGSRHWSLYCGIILTSCIEVLIVLFIPLQAYYNNVSLEYIIIIAIVGSLPQLFSLQVGRYVDHLNEIKVVFIWLLGIISSLAFITYFNSNFAIVAACFILGLSNVIFGMLQKNIISKLANRMNYGRTSSAFEFMATISDVIIPIIFGFIIGEFGLFILMYIVIGYSLVVLYIFSMSYLGNKSTEVEIAR